MKKTTPPPPPSKRTADRAEQAFERLRQAILTGELREGERVKESRLAGEWGIGITPLREAVRRMAAMGYLVLKANHAPVVRQLTARDVQQIYEIREALECMALRSCWDSIDQKSLDTLHSLVAKVDKATGRETRLRRQFALDTALHGLWSSPAENRWLSSTLEQLILYRPNITSLMAQHARYVEEAYMQHQQILEAIQNRNLPVALRRLAQHIRHSGTTLVAVTSP